MDQAALSEELSEAREKLKSADVRVIETSNQPFDSFVLRETSLDEAVDLALDVDSDVVYLLEGRDETDVLRAAGVCFYYQDRAHSVVHRNEAEIEPDPAESRQGYSPFGEETKEERERRQELVDEILSEYKEHLTEENQFELENRPERMRVRRLIRMRDRLEEEARTDPEEEKRLARLVYENEKFNNRFNQTDTEMLLDKMGVDYDPELIRIEEVHKRAKSLIKINK
jgi:hypothetical protein